MSDGAKTVAVVKQLQEIPKRKPMEELRAGEFHQQSSLGGLGSFAAINASLLGNKCVLLPKSAVGFHARVISENFEHSQVDS